jgi:hypothetical protein
VHFYTTDFTIAHGKAFVADLDAHRFAKVFKDTAEKDALVRLNVCL